MPTQLREKNEFKEEGPGLGALQPAGAPQELRPVPASLTRASSRGGNGTSPPGPGAYAEPDESAEATGTAQQTAAGRERGGTRGSRAHSPARREGTSPQRPSARPRRLPFLSRSHPGPGPAARHQSRPPFSQSAAGMAVTRGGSRRLAERPCRAASVTARPLVEVAPWGPAASRGRRCCCCTAAGR